jgi:CRISPR-associated protein Cas1
MRDRLAALRAEGHDPAHGGAAAEARRQSLARRRAAGEPLGRAAAKAKREGSPPADPPVPAPPSPAERGRQWSDTAQRYAAKTQQALRNDRSVLILAGYGAALRVERGALVVKEGFTYHPQTPVTHVLHPAMHHVGRIVCLDCRGAVSFDAVRWCASQHVAVSLLDRHGQLVSELAPPTSADVALRRAQYSLTAQQRANVAAALLRAKLQAQAATLAAYVPDAFYAVGVLATVQQLLHIPVQHPFELFPIEMRAAAAYFEAWQGVGVRWKASDKRKVPPHWLTVRTRASTLGSARNRHAVDPCNAILNYAYGMLEGQCRTALAAVGFDVACGVLHADKQNRDSLVYDLMEPLRPLVDAKVLGLLARTTFHYGDFLLANDGACRVHPQLARYVVSTCRLPDAPVIDTARRLRGDVLHAARMGVPGSHAQGNA